MKKLVIFALLLNACGADDSVGAEQPEGGAPVTTVYVMVAAGSGGDGGASSESAGGTAASETATVEPLCVPGASVECACADGTTSAQVCNEDGGGFGECDCADPAGYSGECLYVGPSINTCVCGTEYPYIYVNCSVAPMAQCTDTLDCTGITEPITSAPGVYCCASEPSM